ncbi:sugar kinase [Pseudoxanthomonas sp. PXM02]|uniref:sugar kinase n=1 Tax=Pseudoxanthomonas sp. PXM02 TaxID=2769294 RepID=UPI00177B3A67|nr:sugar kinase [Pseudoxanthomonas sp. PXM02]MBD9479228.1 sugar kinase [Pseudoxanthomonas sp. PXM02]
MGKIVCFGELLLRLGAPGRQVLLQSPVLDVHVGGAEANVAVSLARFGHDARMVGLVTDNALGEAALGELRRYRVDTRAVQQSAGRMGLYFLTPGAIQRPSEVLYDRADSVFARAGGGTHDWPALLEGADWLHVSGVTPALGQSAADGVLLAVKAARASGAKVSFDGNFRPKLWDAWGGDAPAILRGLMSQADLLFASQRDLQVVLGLDFPQATPQERFAAGAAAAFKAFPHLQQMAATVRVQRSVDHHALSGITALRDGSLLTTPSYEVSPIVDRIGTGDAFAAGVLHGGLTGLSAAEALHFGVAAACLKHSLPGDFNLVAAADVQAFLGENSLDVKR